MIEFSAVSRSYGHKPAVADLDLTIPAGELFALLGPNGAGKTTTIRMLVGLLAPSRGSIRVRGHDVVADPRAAHLHLGYVPDEPTLYEKLTGREFLWFIADMFGMPRSAAAAAIEAQIATFELGAFVDDLAESYSLGMRQRLVFAAALVHDPAVLVLDEPMVGLDPRSMRIVKDMLRQRVGRGMTVFMSTHLLALAEELADRLGIMVHGRLRFLGTVADLRRQVAGSGAAGLEQLYLELTDQVGAAGDPHPAETDR